MKKKFLSGTKSLGIFTAVSALGLLLSYSIRFLFVFVDAFLFEKASFALYLFAVAVTVFMFSVLCLKMRGKEIASKLVKVGVALGYFVSIMLVIVPIIVLITDKTSVSTFFTLLKQALPVWSVAGFGLFFILIFPVIKNNGIKKAVTVVSVCVFAFVVYASLFPVVPYSFTSGPVVFDNGKGDYSVVFATTDKGTGYIEYSLNGEKIRVFDENNGRKNGQSTIHTVTVDKEALSGNTYKVGSTRSVDEISYGGRNGKTIESGEYTFNDSFGKNINVLSVSDWHTENAKAINAVKNIPEEYQAVVLLGDCAPSLMSEYDVSKYIVDFAFELTGGEMPIIYTRGNHETRGVEAVNLSDYLGIDQFYFETEIGDYNIIVLDSCEDKEDSHPEYGGMVDYKAYRTKMVQWLDKLENEDEENTLVFCHSKDICIEEDLSAKALDKLKKMNTSLIVSGHKHTIEYDKESAIPTFVDGGINSNGGGSYVASMIKLSPSSIGILCYDNDGEKLVDEELKWKVQ